MSARVNPAAWVAGGVLAATGHLSEGLRVDEASERLTRELVGSSLWAPTIVTPNVELDRFVSETMQPAARWTTPDTEVVVTVQRALREAWKVVTAQMPHEPTDASVRLRVTGRPDLDALSSVRKVGDLHVVAHLEHDAGRAFWRWPLRVAVARGAHAAQWAEELRGSGRYRALYDVRVLEPEEEGTFEILVLESSSDLAPGVRTACVLTPGAEMFDLGPEIAEKLSDLDPAALVTSRALNLSWFEHTVRQLAHDEPLDVAVELSHPEAVIAADDDLLALTSVRAWSVRAAEQLTLYLGSATVLPVTEEAEDRIGLGSTPTVEVIADRLRNTVVHQPFDFENEGGSIIAAIVDGVDPGGEMTTIESHLLRAAPPELGEAPPEVMSDGEEERTAERPRPDPPDRPPARPERRLQAQVVDPVTKKPVHDRFLADRPNHVKVRIAAEVAPGAVPGDRPFESPTPGRDVDLTVVVIAGSTHAARKLTLPAVADSAWTRAVPFRVPAGQEQFEVFIEVRHQRRVVQSAVLSGPVLQAGAPAPAEGLRLSVDVSTPAGAVEQIRPAGATLTIVPDLKGEPRLLDLARSRPVDPERLASATKSVRKTLLDAFLAPPKSLDEAARALARLAIRGRTLYQQLVARRYDDVEWIHVSTFASANLPLELVYTHPMPRDEGVAVCSPARAGATECKLTCPDRDRSDCVCPFGFWATSKVVERRAHVDDREVTAPGAAKTISLLSVAAAGVSVKADEVDRTTTRRILDAIRSAVAANCFHPVTTWAELAVAARVPPSVVILVTHTVPGDPEDDLSIKLELGGDASDLHRIDERYINPDIREPGPVVLAIGCDTADLDAAFADYVGLLHAAGAELVVSAIAPVPAVQVADFIERFFSALPDYLAAEGVHRFGEVLTDVRRATVATGDVLALALTASGDADVALACR